MIDLKKLDTLIEPVLKENEIVKHSVKFIPGKNSTLEICLMKADGTIDLDTCERVSQQISSILDELDGDEGNYMLDVCSFGAERVLENEQEIRNEIGNYVHIDLKNPVKGMTEIEGVLSEDNDEGLTISYLLKGVKKTAVIEKDNIRLIRLAVKL
ncbi:MAG: ribosome maturation factor RimP [Erysipelotrichaceae bacterium]|nr:ribosome maturation factor RimP [Erysipelotrichaceae bacterium]